MIEGIRLKPCPFCGGKDIRYSIKSAGKWKGMYHASMYCNKCHCYGARILYDANSYAGYKRYTVEKDEELKSKAMEAWNERRDNNG